MKPVLILAIDTSCDDTSVAVLQNDCVQSNVISSQVDIHKEWGGVVPTLARREHEKMIDGCIGLALKRAGLDEITEVDAIAVTYGPGLAPALEVGVNKAKELAKLHDLPLIAVNHMEGHALSALLKNKNGKRYSGMAEPLFPFLAVCVSGGHTELVWVKEIGSYELLGQTLDDAAGEAFDKVARMLDLGYPGGAVVAKLSENGDATRFELPRPMKDRKDFHFSFSGLKTACLYQTNELKEEYGKDFAKLIPDYCASFQEAVVDALLLKIIPLVRQREPKMVVLGGGVSANNRLRSKLRSAIRKFDIPLYSPAKQLCTDNAAMIGLVALYKFNRNEFVKNIVELERDPSITIETEQIR
jgi:N6-L-threonylcarbamoyladenine synthase